MNSKNIINVSLFALLSVSAFALTGCVAEMGESDVAEEDIVQAEEAIGTECAAANPVKYFVGGFDYTSPQTYTTANCYKAVPVTVGNYEAGFPPPPPDTFEHELWTHVSWADAALSTQAACSAAWVRADVFKYVNNIPVYLGYLEDKGGWDSFLNTCMHPYVDITGFLQNGESYMVAATARTAATSAAPTRKVSVKSMWVSIPE